MINSAEYALMIWFGFYIINHSLILKFFRDKLYPKVNSKLLYLIKCSFCFTFWISLILYLFKFIPLIFIFVAPPINLIIELLFLSLTDSDN